MRVLMMAVVVLAISSGHTPASDAEWMMRVDRGDAVYIWPVASIDSLTFFIATPPVQKIQVPPGVFTMGDGVAICGVNQRQVTLTRAFHLGRHPVTNQQYLVALQWAYDHGYVTVWPCDCEYWNWGQDMGDCVIDYLDYGLESLLRLDTDYSEIQFDGAGTFYLRESPSNQAQQAYPDGYDPADHPVKEVTWYGAARYCDWLSLMAGLPRAYQHSGDWACNGGDPYGAHGYRLPTDAEWEYAAQWNDGRIYPWGDEDPDCERVNCCNCIGWTTPVGTYPDAPAALTLKDMAGNIREWCNDWLQCSLGTAPVTDPTGPGSGISRVLRGGDWNSQVRRAYRREYPPGCPHPDQGMGYDEYPGFRIARTVHP